MAPLAECSSWHRQFGDNFDLANPELLPPTSEQTAEFLSAHPGTVFITGETGGLGQEIAKIMMAQAKSPILGASLYRRPASIVDLNFHAQESEVGYLPMQVDLANSRLLQERLRDGELIPNPDAISHVVLSHGTNFSRPIKEIDVDWLHASMEVNCYSTVVLANWMTQQWAAIAMNQTENERKDRSILYVSSVAVPGASSDELAYHAAKAASIQFFKSGFRDYSPLGIRFNIISPGLMLGTPMGDQTAQERPGVLKRLPLGIPTNAKNVARYAYDMLTDPTLTGANFHVNAGRHPTLGY